MENKTITTQELFTGQIVWHAFASRTDIFNVAEHKLKIGRIKFRLDYKVCIVLDYLPGKEFHVDIDSFFIYEGKYCFKF